MYKHAISICVLLLYLGGSSGKAYGQTPIVVSSTPMSVYAYVSNENGPGFKEGYTPLSSYLDPSPANTYISVPSTAGDYAFWCWYINGQFTENYNASFMPNPSVGGTYEAVYVTAGTLATLNVESSPVTGIPIVGTPGGTTGYTVIWAEGLFFTLTAPPLVNSGGQEYVFSTWIVDGNPVKVKGTTMKAYLLGDSTIEATYVPLELNITYPSAAGITLVQGSVCVIQWNSEGLSSKDAITIELYNSNGDSWVLAKSASSKKDSFKWKVAGSKKYPPGSDYTIRISTMDGALVSESANEFSIVPK